MHAVAGAGEQSGRFKDRPPDRRSRRNYPPIERFQAVLTSVHVYRGNRTLRERGVRLTWVKSDRLKTHKGDRQHAVEGHDTVGSSRRPENPDCFLSSMATARTPLVPGWFRPISIPLGGSYTRFEPFFLKGSSDLPSLRQNPSLNPVSDTCETRNPPLIVYPDVSHPKRTPLKVLDTSGRDSAILRLSRTKCSWTVGTRIPT